ncbi:MAG TPA: hypothetical protein VN516_01300 [Candidatus Baltobacteraceae bacterium]|nr:hypothetical protein [Candidatus Baltobacteraceae bacterium]
MADVPPNPPNIPGVPLGAEPGKKTTGKVAPKKETVRITLPPKPSAAPTIKLPTLPPGGPTGAPSAAPAPAARPAPTAAAPRTAAAPAAAPVAGRPTTAAPVQRPATAVAAAAPTVGAFDKILAIAAMVMALGAVGTTVWMMLMLNQAIQQQ